MGENGLYCTSRQLMGRAKFKYVLCVDIYFELNYIFQLNIKTRFLIILFLSLD